MARYVCDFAQVRETGENLCRTAKDLTAAINSYSSEMDSALSKWSGSAQQSFESANLSKIKKATAVADYVNSLGEFVKSAAEQIEELETELASLTI